MTKLKRVEPQVMQPSSQLMGFAALYSAFYWPASPISRRRSVAITKHSWGRQIMESVKPLGRKKLVVIGAGLMRTGTSSLKAALERLLRTPCYHMSRVALEYREPAIRRWLRVYRSEGAGLEEALGDFEATVDYPACGFYRELTKLHPEAKVVLTVRDARDWVASCRATMLSPAMLAAPSAGRRLMHAAEGTGSLLALHDAMFRHTLGADYATASDAELEAAFARWNAAVEASVAPERLLVFDARAGWGPLCTFLGLPVPVAGDGVGVEAFPHANRRDQMRAVLARQLRRADALDRVIRGLLLLLLAAVTTALLFLLLSPLNPLW